MTSDSPAPADPRAAPVLRALALCDLADSTALVERIGDRAAADLLHRHDRMARDLLLEHRGREIDKTDGFLLLFERPSQALAFALAYQSALRALSRDVGQPLRARIGIHVGDVVLWDNDAADVARGAKPVEVEGLVKPVAARLMTLARPGQILLSGIAHALTQRAEGDLRERFPGIAFRNHGRYGLKGLPDPIPVWEAGIVGEASFQRPPSGDKAWRHLPWWRRPRVLALQAAVLLLAAAVPFLLSLRAGPAFAFAERDWVLVADLANHTGEALLDGSLDAAFRIGLEQSRYVNVIPALQARDALRRMQRPIDSPLDRALAAEVALREGARAVILPTVSEVGGRLRVSAEVIEPATQTTVYAEAVDGEGLDSVLGSLDAVSRRLRGRLGESLAMIDGDTLPLEKVTTANLEALKAYSGGLERMQKGDLDAALNLLAYATEIDPGFAMAYARRGGLLLSFERFAEAREAIDRALALRDRLSARERLYVEAQSARFGRPADMIRLWERFAAVYPDAAAGQNNVGILLYMLYNDYGRAAASLRDVVDREHALRNYSLHALASVQIADGRIADAVRSHEAAQALSPATVYFGYADALGAAGRHAEALRYLDEAPRTSPVVEAERPLRRIAVLTDQGRFADARRAMQGALPVLEALPVPGFAWRGWAAQHGVLAALDPPAARADAEARVAAIRERLAADPLADLDGPEHLLWWGIAAARAGATAIASAISADLEASNAADGFPVRQQLLATLRAELALTAGDAAGARALLEPLRAPHASWYLRHALSRACRALADAACERAELEWLVAARGRAWSEWIDQQLGQTGRLIDWNRAQLELAERLAADGDRDAARRHAEAFLAQWRSGEPPPVLIERARAVLAADPTPETPAAG